MKLKIYMLRENTDSSNDITLFGSQDELDAKCVEIIREHGNEVAKRLLESDGLIEAWPKFAADNEFGEDFYGRDEQEIDLPEPYASAPEMLEALKEIAEVPLNVAGYNSIQAVRLRFVSMQTVARAALSKAGGDT